MKKILTLLMAFFTLTILSIAHPKKLVFESFVEYKVQDTKHYLPLTLKLGKSEGKDLLYIPDWGRIFLQKTKDGYKDINNNFDLIENKDGSITIKANVTMVDLNYSMPTKYKKGEFYHSLTGYLHSHIYPNLEQGLIKIGDVDYKVNKSLNDFDNCTLYTEENGKFTVLYLKSWNRPTAPMPDMAEFKFEAILNK